MNLSVPSKLIGFAGLLSVSTSWGANITNLPTSSAVVSSADTAGQSVVIGTVTIDNSVLPSAGAFTASTNAADTGTVNNGLTLNVTFTPTGADLSAVANPNSSMNVRLLAEIGGSGSGAGLFLVNGVPTFVAKVGGGPTDNPTNGTDTALGTTPPNDY